MSGQKDKREPRNIKSVIYLFWSTGLPYNQPKFSPCASWNTTAVLFSTLRETGYYPNEVFVDTNNTMYILSSYNETVFIWPQNSIAPTRILSGGMLSSLTLVVDDEQNIYVSHILGKFQVERWPSNVTSNRETAWLPNEECSGLFIDIDQSFYCALRDLHRVIRKSKNDAVNRSIIIAGITCAGSRADMLTYPFGIFVDTNFNLYVADSGNNRIQLFRFNETNGTTVAGTGAPNTIALNSPRDVTLDGDGYLFIVDSYAHRIVRSGPNGFQCIFGCRGSNVPTLQRLTYPYTLTFDTDGNIIVTDRGSHRIVKLQLTSNHCGMQLSLLIDLGDLRTL